MELDWIQTFLHVADLGSISRAAERLHIAQPALSRRIRLLEAELGGPVFARHARGVSLTERGQRLLDPARAVMAGLAAVRRQTDVAGGLAGTVRLGMTPTVAQVMTLPLADEMARAHPAVRLSLTTGYSGHLLDWLKRGAIDCCIAYDPAPTDLVATKPVLDEALLLVGRGEDGLDQARPVPFADLARRALILPTPLHGLRRNLDAAAAHAGIALRARLEIDSLEATIDLVRAGFGQAVLPLAPLRDRVARGELSVAPLDDPSPQRRVVIAWSIDRPLVPAGRATVDTLVGLACDLVGSGTWQGRAIVR